MKKTKYKTIKRTPYRTGPGSSYAIVDVLKKGTSIVVVERKGNWCKFEYDDKYYYCSIKRLKEIINYSDVVGPLVLPLAKTVVKNKSEHVSGAYTYKKDKINCSVFVSKVLQDAGLLKEGTTLYHTDKDYPKGELNGVVKNRTRVKHYEWKKTNVKYKDLPDKYRKPGCVYVYASSIAIVGKDGYIYGCHSSGSTYTKLSMIRHKSKSYEYTSSILAVGVPKTE